MFYLHTGKPHIQLMRQIAWGWYRFVPYSFQKYNMRTSFNLSHIHGRNVLMYVHVTHSVWRTSISEDTLYTYVPWNHLLTHFTFCIIWCNTTPLPINISHHLNLVSDVRLRSSLKIRLYHTGNYLVRRLSLKEYSI